MQKKKSIQEFIENRYPKDMAFKTVKLQNYTKIVNHKKEAQLELVVLT